MKDQSGYEHICQIFESYLSGQIDGWQLDTEFNRSFNLGEDSHDLTSRQRSILSPLSTLIARFSDIEADLKAYPRTYVEDAELREHIAGALKALREGDKLSDAELK